MSRVLKALILLVPLTLGGCNYLAALLYVVTPEQPTETVPAEFDRFEDRRVAVVVYTGEMVQYEYPDAARQLTYRLAARLKANVKKIDLVAPQKIVAYQMRNVYWDEMDKTKLGEEFSADYVLYVPVAEFSTREPGSTALYRGRITGDIRVYDTSLPEGNALVYHKDGIRAVYPPKATTIHAGSAGERKVRGPAVDIFTSLVARNFYEHESLKKDDEKWSDR